MQEVRSHIISKTCGIIPVWFKYSIYLKMFKTHREVKFGLKFVQIKNLTAFLNLQ